MALRLFLALTLLLLLKIAAATTFGPVQDGLLTALLLADLLALLTTPSWVAMAAGANRATGPLRTFVAVPLIYLGLITTNVLLQIPLAFASTPDVVEGMTRVVTVALPQSMLGGVAGAMVLWLVATVLAFVYTGFKLRFVPTETDRKRADAFVSSHYKVRLGRAALPVAQARPEKVVSAKAALTAAAAAAAGLAAASAPREPSAKSA